MHIKDTLQKMGFSKREAAVYLAVLELGTAGAQDIARLSGEKRTTVYEICKSLAQKGIVTESQKNTKKVFSAEDPSALAVNLLSQQSALNTIMPTLKAMMQTNTTKPNIRYYDTLDGIRTAYEDLLTTKPDEILTMLSPAHLTETLGKKWLTDFIQRRVIMGIPVRAISLEKKDQDITQYWHARDPEDLRKMRFLQVDEIPAIDILIYKNKIMFSAFGTEKMAFIIESNIISDYTRMLFNIGWKILPSK